jgi:hypothetical protein
MSNRALATWATKKVEFVVGEMVISRLLRRKRRVFYNKEVFQRIKEEKEIFMPKSGGGYLSLISDHARAKCYSDGRFDYSCSTMILSENGEGTWSYRIGFF